MRGLRKRYKRTEAVRGIDLDVREREVFAFLGPNGAGKTTTVEILEGYRSRDAGDVKVLGLDPAGRPRALRERMGVVLQDSRADTDLKVGEMVRMFAGYFERPRPVGEVIALAGLNGVEGQRTHRLSGGQRRRLDLALALVGDPDLLFLDEPTTGFDPAARREMWQTLARLKSLGKTIFLTTHFMDEAEHLADRVAIMVRGRIVAAGALDDLMRSVDQDSEIVFRLPEGLPSTEVPSVGKESTIEGGWVRIATSRPSADLTAVAAWASERGIDLDDLATRRPSLEDVYLRLTEEQQA